MPYIYKITNSVNDKVYIGQTVRTIQQRFNQHKCDSIRDNTNHIKLYHAMQKYGKDKFSVSLIEECDKEHLDEREIYWIAQYDSFFNGYNTTKGGGGRETIDPKRILKLWNEGKIVTDIIAETGHAHETVVRVLTDYGITEKERNARARLSQSRKVKVPIYQYGADGTFIAEFPSVWEAEKELGILRDCITGVLCGKHGLAGGYQWRRYKKDKIAPNKNKTDPLPKTVYQYTIDGEYITEYPSFASASKAVGVFESAIRRASNDYIHLTTGGYRWCREKLDKLPPRIRRYRGKNKNVRDANRG